METTNNFGTITTYAAPWKGNEKVPTNISGIKGTCYLKDLNQKEVEIYAEQVKQEIIRVFNIPIKIKI